MKYRHLKGYKYELMRAVVVKTQIGNISLTPGKAKLNWCKFAKGKLVIYKGYAWDGPSGPTIDTKNFMRGSLVHDAYYQLMREGYIEPGVWRKYADDELRRICIEDGMSRFRAWYVWKAVRAFGKYTCVKRKNPRGKIIQICLALAAMLLMTGCTFVWTDKVVLFDLLKDRDIDTISLISEPNYIEIIAEKYKSDPKSVKLITPTIGASTE
jgi:hypothetical protein